MCRLAALADLSRALAKSSSALAARAALCRASSRAAAAEASALVWMAAALAARKSLAVKFVFNPAACKAARTACVVLALSTTTLILNFSLWSKVFISPTNFFLSKPTSSFACKSLVISAFNFYVVPLSYHGIKYRSKGFQDQPYIIVFVLLIIIDINCCFSIAILVFPAFGSILYITYGRGFEVFCIVFLSLAVFVTICNHNRHIHCQQFNLCICKYPINTKQRFTYWNPK